MNPLEAYEYAVIYGPSKETRKIACKDPWLVYMYAKIIDKKPRKDTRKAACKNPEIAYWYAEDVDECFHKDTWEAVQNTEYEQKYKTFANSTMKEEII